ncbi:MAG: 5'/3'-nucleotidase SurE, partial [Candidatus Omnitrophica bacterium]|nr:5'/3'-nucleotidase SurE [Candidatus Omnitrophota bacterium]
MNSERPHFLLTNDDGIDALGINMLYEVLQNHGRVTMIAPDQERSAVSHAFSLHHPLRLIKRRESVYSLSGTPVDCVMFGLRGFLDPEDLPDFVLSGINHGANLGDDVTYSGTVAAAFEGHLLGFPSVAFSLASGTGDFGLAAAAARELVLQLAARERVPTLLLNVNFPDSPEYRGLRVTSLGHRRYEDVIDERTDPRGKTYY